jgi:hypothetical protein
MFFKFEILPRFSPSVSPSLNGRRLLYSIIFRKAVLR